MILQMAAERFDPTTSAAVQTTRADSRMLGKINKRRYPLQTYEDYRERGPSPVLES